jgi:hypothetical protein
MEGGDQTSWSEAKAVAGSVEVTLIHSKLKGGRNEDKRKA